MHLLRLAVLLPTTLVMGQTLGVIKVPHIADGGGWSTSLTVINAERRLPVRVLINFFGADGQRLEMPIKGLGTVMTVDQDLQPSASLVLETEGKSAAVRSGWAEIDANGGNGPLVRAYAIFRQHVEGRPDYEAVVPGDWGRCGSTVSGFPFDNTNGMVSAFAVVNDMTTSPADITALVFDENGRVIADRVTVVTLPPRGHTAFALTDKLPELAGRRGTISFSVGTTAIGLRFNPTGPFTSLPSYW